MTANELSIVLEANTQRKEMREMSIRNTLLAMIVMLVVAACSSNAATPTPTDAPTQTPMIITATALPTTIPTNTSIPTNTPPPASTARPTAIIPAACTNDLTFIADMSIPDGSVVAPGSTITKTWRVRNDGTCAWNSNYTFRQIDGDAMTASTISAPTVGRGQIVDISVTLTVGTNVSLYDALERATFRMYNASGIPFGDTPYVEVAIQSNNTGCTRGMSVVTAPAEIGFMTSGETLPVSWTLRNTGTCAWESLVIERLGSGSPLIASNLPLNVPTISPNQTYTFTVNATFASGTVTSGLYSMVMMLRDSAGSPVGTTIVYQAEYDDGTACVWDSDFVSDITIPDGTIVNIGQSFTKTWRIENSGTCPWDNFTLRMIEDESGVFEIVGVNDFITLPFVAPGEEVDISITLRLTSNATAGETYRSSFQVQGVSNTFFGTMPYVEVEAAG